MSLQVWLPLNGNLNNQGLNNVTVTNSGATINASGKTGSCYQFGTASSYMMLPKEAMASFTSEASVCFWFKILSWNTSYATYFQAGLGSTPWAHYIFGFLRNGTNSNCCFTISNGTTASNATYLTSTLELNTWYHIGLCYKTGHCLIYINGQLHNDYSTSLVPNFAGITTITLGACNNKTGYQTNCLMNDFRIYNHCLSTKEVEEISKGLILHYKLDAGLFGNENLATCTTSQYNLAASTSNYNYFWANSSTLEPNTTYTFSAEVEVSDATKCTIYNYTSSGNSGSINHNFPADVQRHSWTFTTTTTGLGVICYAGNSGATAGHSAIYRNIKIEKGEIATPYIPRASEMNLNTNTIYDCSGYQNHGTLNNITLISNSSRYNIASSFNGSSSYVKVNENNWMAQHALAMTINLWVKAASWPGTIRIFSCTESGGFNIEPGNSGYYRFPLYVCTNAAQTSYAYKYDSNELQIAALPINEWCMLTLIYDSTGTRTYINGNLHHTYTNTSYGIRFNMNARLFLGCEANTANPSSPYFNGQMNDFRIYYTVLSEADILELYNTSMSIDKSGNCYARELIE